MEVPRERMGPSTGERLARAAVFGFLLLAVVLLAFALGWGTNQWLDDDDGNTIIVGDRDPSDGTDDGVEEEGSFHGEALDEIYDIIGREFVDRELIDPEVLETAAINGVVGALNDPHSAYLTPADLQAGALDLSSTYQGIGASVTDRNGVIEIIAPFRDSPAEQAGVRAGDVIVEVNGTSTDGWTDQEAVQAIRGESGTEVTLVVRHMDGDALETLTIVRGEIEIQSVFTEPLLEAIPGESGTALVDRDGEPVTDLAYINLAQFHEGTEAEIHEALTAADENPAYTGLILDLRANPGGLLTATVASADEFLDEGTILIDRRESGEERYTATEGGAFTTKPVVILIDAFSASGAEVLAASLRDNGRAVIIGENSFGKGTVNRLIPLDECGSSECGALYLSIGRWLTPNGNQIEGEGVTPDTVLPMTTEQYQAEGDIQLFAAIDALRGQ